MAKFELLLGVKYGRAGNSYFEKIKKKVKKVSQSINQQSILQNLHQKQSSQQDEINPPNYQQQYKQLLQQQQYKILSHEQPKINALRNRQQTLLVPPPAVDDSQGKEKKKSFEQAHTTQPTQQKPQNQHVVLIPEQPKRISKPASPDLVTQEKPQRLEPFEPFEQPEPQISNTPQKRLNKEVLGLPLKTPGTASPLYFQKFKHKQLLQRDHLQSQLPAKIAVNESIPLTSVGMSLQENDKERCLQNQTSYENMIHKQHQQVEKSSISEKASTTLPPHVPFQEHPCVPFTELQEKNCNSNVFSSTPIGLNCQQQLQ